MMPCFQIFIIFFSRTFSRIMCINRPLLGLTWEECKRRCPPGVYAACHNAHDSVTVSGVVDGVDKMLAELKQEGIFAREVASAGMASHRSEWCVLDEEQRKVMEPVSVGIADVNW